MQRTVEQTVDIPVPFGGRPLHGFHTGQSSTAFIEQLVDTGDLQGFHPRHGFAQRSAAQNDDFPVPDGRGTSRFGGLHGSPRRQGSTAVRGALRPGLRVLVFDSQARWSKRSGLGGGGWLSTPRPWTCTSTQPSSGLRILNEGAYGASSAMLASTVDTYFASVLVAFGEFSHLSNGRRLLLRIQRNAELRQWIRLHGVLLVGFLRAPGIRQSLVSVSLAVTC